MGKTLRRNSLMKLEEKQKKIKKPHTYWRVTWKNPLKTCPKTWAKEGSWTFNDRQIALRDMSWYGMYYGTIEGPFPVVYRKSHRERTRTRNNGESSHSGSRRSNEND